MSKSYGDLTPDEIRDAIYTANNVIRPNYLMAQALNGDEQARREYNNFNNQNPTQAIVNGLARPTLLTLASGGAGAVPYGMLDGFVEGMASTDNPETGYKQALISGMLSKLGATGLAKVFGVDKGISLVGRGMAKNTGRTLKQNTKATGATLGDIIGEAVNNY